MEKKAITKKIIKSGAKATANISTNLSLAWLFHQKKCPEHLLKRD